MPKYGMVIDQKRCIGCMACVVACKRENNVPEEHYRTRVAETVYGKFPNLLMEMRPELCNHCKNAPCVYNCPTGASYKRDDGIVMINQKKCVGCKACLAACPYDMRFIDPKTGTAHKCTLCEHRIKEGKDPACVPTCLSKARIFGDFDDPESPVSKILAKEFLRELLPAAGTKPSVYYKGQILL